MRLGDNYNFISGENSDVFNDFPREIDVWRDLGGYYGDSNAVFVGNGWNSLNIGLVYEARLDNFLGLDYLFSVRMDKHTYSDFLISPRISISKVDESSLRRRVSIC